MDRNGLSPLAGAPKEKRKRPIIDSIRITRPNRASPLLLFSSSFHLSILLQTRNTCRRKPEPNTGSSPSWNSIKIQ